MGMAIQAAMEVGTLERSSDGIVISTVTFFLVR